MPEALALVGPTGVQLLVFFCFIFSVISCCQVLIVVSSLYSFDFYVLEGVALMSCVYYGRAKGEGCGYEKSMSLHVCPGEFYILDSRSANCWERNCPFGFLLVVF